jgi:hypothetical protein
MLKRVWIMKLSPRKTGHSLRMTMRTISLGSTWTEAGRIGGYRKPILERR